MPVTPDERSMLDDHDQSSVAVSSSTARPEPDGGQQATDAGDSDSGSPPGPSGHGGSRGRRPWRRRLAWGVASTLGTVIVAAIVAAFVTVPYYAITPGSGLDVSKLIKVPKQVGHDHLGSVLLSDVELVPLHALSYLYYGFDANAQVVSSSALVGTASSAQYERQGVVDMYNARQAATVVALHQLGYDTRAVPDGIIVYQPVAGSAGSQGLDVGDVIVSVDGHAVRTIAGLSARLGQYRPGAAVVLGLRGLLAAPRRAVRLRLGEVRVEGTGASATEVCAAPGTDTSLQPLEVHGAPGACLGISAEQAYETAGLPFKVAISSGGIVGPSAGLAFTLGLIEKLDTQDLTAGLKVAATGTMSVTGQVGDVGGVAQKTIAVRAAGASLFFVPPDELRTAEAHAGPALKVLAVSTIGQAVADLEQLGGRLTPPSAAR